MHTHIIYYAVYKNIIVYIGSGAPNRKNHVTSGTSHVYELNRLHFLEPNSVSVHTLKGFSSQEEALKEEKELILKFKPKYNSQHLEGYTERFQCDAQEIEKYKGNFIESGNCLAKTPYEKILNGQVPSVQNAINYYLDPETNNQVLFNVFPQFKEWLDVGITPQNMATCGMVKNAINELAESYRTLNSIKEELNNFLTIGTEYTSEQLKTIVAPYLEKSGIKVTSQAINKFIKEFYEVEDKSIWAENKTVKVKYIKAKIK